MEVYSHYDVSLARNCDPTGDPISMDYIFTCKLHPENHPGGALICACAKTGNGTTNLQKRMDTYLKKLGFEHEKKRDETTIPYSPEAHRALIALCCAKSSCPINSVLDDDYQREVQMLRPGTKLPSANTVQRDLINIYTHMSIYVMNYFLVRLI